MGWIGPDARIEEKEQAVVAAYEYLNTHPSGRDPATNIVMIKQGREPPTFTGWFLAWDPHMWSNGKSYDQIKAEMGSDDLFKSITLEELSNGNDSSHAPELIQVLDGQTKRYLTYAELKNINPDEAFGVDITKKEDHLIDSEFDTVFGVSRS